MERNPNLFAYFLLMAIVDTAMILTPHFPSDLVFTVSYLFSVPFIVSSTVEINSSSKLDKKEKTSLTFGFVVMPLIIGIIYFISTRKRLVQH